LMCLVIVMVGKAGTGQVQLRLLVLLLVRKPPVSAGHANPNTNPSPLAGVNANLRAREVLGGGVPVGTSGAAALVLKVLPQPFKVTSRKRSAELALSKLPLYPLSIEAAGISLSTQGFQRLNRPLFYRCTCRHYQCTCVQVELQGMNLSYR
jgi:hypothetical protein